MRHGVKEFEVLKNEKSFLEFIAIYSCEGSRKGRNEVAVTNSDLPIKMSLYWFKKLTKKKIGYRVFIYIDHDENNVKDYWAINLGIDIQDIKTSVKQDAKLRHRNWRLQYGTFVVRVGDTYFRSKLQASMDGYCKKRLG